MSRTIVALISLMRAPNVTRALLSTATPPVFSMSVRKAAISPSVRPTLRSAALTVMVFGPVAATLLLLLSL